MRSARDEGGDRGRRVKVWLSWRARVPTSVYPEPLIRVTSNQIFDERGEVGRVGSYIAFEIPGPDKLKRRLDAYHVALLALFPHSIGEKDGSAGAQREGGDPRGSACEPTEERNEDAFVRLRVQVGENAERSALLQNAQRSARR